MCLEHRKGNSGYYTTEEQWPSPSAAVGASWTLPPRLVRRWHPGSAGHTAAVSFWVTATVACPQDSVSQQSTLDHSFPSSSKHLPSFGVGWDGGSLRPGLSVVTLSTLTNPESLTAHCPLLERSLSDQGWEQHQSYQYKHTHTHTLRRQFDNMSI